MNKIIPESFYKSGFKKFKFENLRNINKIKNFIYNESLLLKKNKFQDKSKYFELFHKIVNDDKEMNEFRLKLYERINDHTKINISKLIFDSFKSHLTTIFGPDIAVQKNVSISINRPEDKFILGMHRDAPPHSTFSLTIAIPITNFYKTKNLCILDIKQTFDALKIINQSKKFQEFVYKKGRVNSKKLKLSFGEALFFWGGLFHFPPINYEKETRWSINLRFKNLFSPYEGAKELIDFYDILQISKFSKINFDFQKKIITEK